MKKNQKNKFDRHTPSKTTALQAHKDDVEGKHACVCV